MISTVRQVENPLPADDAAFSSVADAEISAYLERAFSRSNASTPALSSFQRQMERYPQLSPAAQLELVADYQRGVEAKAQLAQGLRGAEERKARAAIQRGEYASEHLVASMFKLVLVIARELAQDRYGRERANDLMPDLVAEANVALVEAVGNYDPARCPTFNIYAGRVVRDRVRMTLTKDTPMRLAPSWSRLKRIAAVAIPQLAGELGRQPTKAEVQARLLEKCLAWAEDKLTDAERDLPAAEQREVMLKKLRKQGMLGAIDNLDEVLLATQSVTSLDSPVGEDGSTSLGEMLSGAESDDLFQGAELEELREDLRQALESLNQREREIILYRFGFVDGETWTYPKIAVRYGVTPERIRQIENNVLAKLRSPHGGSSRLAAHLPSQFEETEAEAPPQVQAGKAPKAPPAPKARAARAQPPEPGSRPFHGGTPGPPRGLPGAPDQRGPGHPIRPPGR